MCVSGVCLASLFFLPPRVHVERTCASVCAPTWVAWAHTCMHARARTHTHTQIHLHIHTYTARMRAHTRIDACPHTHLHRSRAHTHAHMHICARAHTVRTRARQCAPIATYTAPGCSQPAASPLHWNLRQEARRTAARVTRLHRLRSTHKTITKASPSSEHATPPDARPRVPT